MRSRASISTLIFIFPRSRFTAKRLQDAGIEPARIEEYRDSIDRLPNLQLLGGLPNVEKRAQLPHEWLETAFPTTEQRLRYVADNDLAGLPLRVEEFHDFYAARKQRILTRLMAVLGVSSATVLPEQQ